MTFDLNFAEISALTEGEKCGVVTFRLRNTKRLHAISRLDSVLTTSSSLPAEGAVVDFEETWHRIRRLPVGEG